MNLIDLMNLESLESTWINLNVGREHPFIDEGDGLTSERERVSLLISHVAYADRHRMGVGAHNTVGCRMHVGDCVVLFEYGRCQYLLYC